MHRRFTRSARRPAFLRTTLTPSRGKALARQPTLPRESKCIVFETLIILLPQTILGGLACLFLLGGTFRVPVRAWGPLALVAICVAAAALQYSSRLELSSAAL